MIDSHSSSIAHHFVSVSVPYLSSLLLYKRRKQAKT